MANIVPFRQRMKTAVSALRGRRAPRQVVYGGERKAMPLLFPDFRTGVPTWHLINLESYVREGFAGNALIYSAIMYKARSLMQVPLRAYKGDPEQPELLPPDDPLAQLCARPNFHQSFPEMSMQATIYLNVSGNAYFIFDRPLKGGFPNNIFCLRPDRIQIIPHKSKRKLVGYWYTPEGVHWPDGVGLLPQDVMHVKFPYPADPLEGMGEGLSPIAPMAKSADVDNAITNFLKMFFERGVMVPGMLTIDADLDDHTIARIGERWKEIYGGYQAWSEEIGIMGSGATYKRIGLDFSEMGFDSLDERNEARILGPFGVPPELIATRLGTKASTYANKELARKQCWEDTLLPELDLFEREWQYYLQGDAGGWVAYDLSKVLALQKDKVSLIGAAHQLWTMGTPANQAISEVGLVMEQIPGGDVGYLPMGMTPVGVATVPRLPAPAETPAPDAEEEERQETTKKGSGPSAGAGGRNRLTEQVKLALAKKTDTIAWMWTPLFTSTASEQFEEDYRELSAALTAARNKSIQEKATINWQWLLREWTTILAAAKGRWREAFLPGITGVITDQAESLNVDFGVQFNVRNLFAEDWFSDYMGEFSEGIVRTTSDDMNALLQQGMSEGWSIPTMQKHLTETFNVWKGDVPAGSYTWDWLEERIPADRSEMIARTETIRASARGSQALYDDWGVQKKQWLTTDDDRACPWCLEMDGKIIAINDSYFGKGSVFVAPSLATGNPVSLNLNYEDVEGPPLHPQCVLPGNVVAVPGLVAGVKSFYDGRAVEIRTGGGRYWATVTENHPILTPDGWIAAKLICEGDNIVVCTEPERVVSSVNPDYKHVPAAVEEVFAALKVAPSMRTSRVPVSPVDLHGDARFVNGDVDVVYPDGFLLGDTKATEPKTVVQDILDNSGAGNIALASDGALTAMLPGLLGATNGLVGGGDLSGAALRAHPAPLHQLGLGTSARLDASPQETPSEYPPANTGLARQFILRFASDIAVEQVVQVRHFDYSGHVYDLQSEIYGLYTCNGILSSNCRCALMPVIPEEGIEPEMEGTVVP